MSARPRYRFKEGQPVLMTLVDEERNTEAKKVYIVQERIGEYVHFRERGGSGFERLSDGQIAPMLSDGRIKPLAMADRDTSEEAILQFYLMHPTRLSDTAKQGLEHKKTYIAALEDRHQKHFAGKTAQERIASAAKQLNDAAPPESVRTVQIWRRLFNERDRTLGALIRKRDIHAARPSRLHPIIQDIFDQSIERYYLNKDALTLKDAWGYASAAIEEAQKENASCAEDLRVPDYTTFWRWLKRRFDRHTVNLHRHDRNTANALSGMVGPGPVYERPLQVVFVDSTAIDLLWRDERGSVRKRLYLTVAVDAFSRMVVGFYLGPQNPSWITVSEALRCAMSPKAWVETLYGKKGKISTEWPCHGMPEMIVVDWGSENRIKELPVVLSTLGITLNYNPAEHPDWKGTVERFMREANRMFHSLPGTTKSNPKHRGKLNPVERAREDGLSFEQIHELFTRWVVNIYHNHEHRELAMSPLQKWEEGCQKCDVLPQPSEQELAIYLGRIQYAEIQKYGINFLWMRYSHPALRAFRPGDGSSARVKFYYDPGNLGCIWVEDPNPKSNRIVQAFSNKYSYASRVTELLHKEIWNRVRRAKRGQRPTEKELAAEWARMHGEFVVTKPPRTRVERRSEPGAARRLPRDAHFRGLPGVAPIAPAKGDLFNDSTKIIGSPGTSTPASDATRATRDDLDHAGPTIVLGTPPEDDEAAPKLTGPKKRLTKGRTHEAVVRPAGPDTQDGRHKRPTTPPEGVDDVIESWLEKGDRPFFERKSSDDQT